MATRDDLGVWRLAHAKSTADEAVDGGRYRAPTLEKKVLLSAITAGTTVSGNISQDSN